MKGLFRQEAVHVDFAPRFRKLMGSKDAAAADAAELMANLARAEVELENLLGVRRVQNYPAERPILRGDVRAQAEHDAMELPHSLGLRKRPVPDIVTLP